MASDLFVDRSSERGPSRVGILPSQDIRQLIENRHIPASAGIGEDQVQPSSLDLRLSERAYRVAASVLPSKSAPLIAKAEAFGIVQERLDLSRSTLFEPGAIYLVELMESLALPPDVYGIANPKSTTGRLDIFTRLLQDVGDEFERVEKGYQGKIYIEVVSQTFPVIVQAGMRLNQLRFGVGRRGMVGELKLKQLDRGDNLLDSVEDNGQAKIDRGLRMTVDLRGNGSGIVGYRARRNVRTPIDLGRIAHYDIAEFWEPIYRHPKLQCILQPNEFYILASKQFVRIPSDLAAEMLPYDIATQEFRAHYAGFFDPGFGYGGSGDIPGTKAVLEVRASHMPILLEDDQYVGRLNYYNMAAVPDKVYGGPIGSSYQQQGLKLSKQFKAEYEPAGEGRPAPDESADRERSSILSY